MKEIINVDGVFGINREESEKIIKFFRHAEIESKDIKTLVENLDIQNAGRIGLLCYVFGRYLEKKEFDEKIKEFMGK